MNDATVLPAFGCQALEARTRTDLRIGAVGSGSDYTPFVQHLGIASHNVGYGGEDAGDYHSIFDSYDHYTRFKDGEFVYGVALAKTLGRSVLRFANADVLPFEFSNFANTVQMYASEIKKELENARTKAEDHNKSVGEGRFEAASDPKDPFVKPALSPVAPYLNFAPLDNALVALENSTRAFALASSKFSALPADKLKELNEILYKTERKLIHADGLPRRPWYRHQIYAPGFYTGYGVKTLPMIREAIEQRNWKEAEEGILRVTGVLERFVGEVERASGVGR